MESAAGSVDPQMETSRSRSRRTVRTEEDAGENRSLLDRGVLRTAVKTDLSLLGGKKRNDVVYATCRKLFSVDLYVFFEGTSFIKRNNEHCSIQDQCLLDSAHISTCLMVNGCVMVVVVQTFF